MKIALEMVIAFYRKKMTKKGAVIKFAIFTLLKILDKRKMQSSISLC